MRPLILLILTLMLANCNQQPHYRVQGYVVGQNIYLASPFAGQLIDLPIHRGQQVETGQLLFRLDPNPQQLLVKQLEEELAQAQSSLIDLQKPRRPEEIQSIEAQILGVEAQIKLAEVRVKRNQELIKRQAVDKDSFDAAIAHLQQQSQLKAQLQAELALAKQGARPDQIQAQAAQVEALQARLADAQWQLRQKSQYAPATGQIFDTYYRQGEYVGNQQPVASLLTPKNILIEFFVPVEALPLLKLNQAVRLSCPGCPEETLAHISYISPEAEFLPPLVYSRENDENLVFRIKARPQRPQDFKPGQPLEVSFP